MILGVLVAWTGGIQTPHGIGAGDPTGIGQAVVGVGRRTRTSNQTTPNPRLGLGGPIEDIGSQQSDVGIALRTSQCTRGQRKSCVSSDGRCKQILNISLNQLLALATTFKRFFES